MTKIVPFGKYKGQPVELLAADRSYCEWLMAQPWFADRFRDVYNIVVNYGSEPQDTPEHNALQARLLDPGFCIRLARAATGPDIWDIDAVIKTARQHEDLRGDAVLAKEETPLSVRNLQFEVRGWDVIFEVAGGKVVSGRSRWGCQSFWFARPDRPFAVECKPTVGDDYPTVLRQIKGYMDRDQRCASTSTAVLLLESFTATGATFEQVRTIFAASRVHVVTLAEIGEGGSLAT